jgi:hypothetical protein
MSAITKLKTSASSFQKAALKGKSKQPGPKDGILLRDFMHDRLYNHQGGYFLKDSHEVGKLTEPIEFNSCRGYYDVRKAIEGNYPKN